MSHAINEGIINFVADRNDASKHDDGQTLNPEEVINLLCNKEYISTACANASIAICKCYRNDIHHMNRKIATFDFHGLAERNKELLSVIENEIFGHTIKDGIIVPHHPKYWDFNGDGTSPVYLRLER